MAYTTLHSVGGHNPRPLFLPIDYRAFKYCSWLYSFDHSSHNHRQSSKSLRPAIFFKRKAKTFKHAKLRSDRSINSPNKTWVESLSSVHCSAIDRRMAINLARRKECLLMPQVVMWFDLANPSLFLAIVECSRECKQNFDLLNFVSHSRNLRNVSGQPLTGFVRKR